MDALPNQFQIRNMEQDICTMMQIDKLQQDPNFLVAATWGVSIDFTHTHKNSIKNNFVEIHYPQTKVSTFTKIINNFWAGILFLRTEESWIGYDFK